MTLRPMLPHQKHAMRYARPRTGIALFMEMRLGKSMVAIRWLKAQANPPRLILVVGPTSVLPGWIDELRLEHVSRRHVVWLTGPVARRVDTVRQLDPAFGPYWCLVNYEALIRGTLLTTVPWDALVLDESTRIKNPSAKVTKALLKIAPRVAYRAVLSGLPAPEGPDNYFPQMVFAHGTFMGHTQFWGWRQRYFYNAGWDWLPKRGTEQKVREAIHTSAFLMTRKEAGIGTRKIYETRTVDMSAAQRVYYRQVKKDFAFETLQTKWATTRMIWLARIAGGCTPGQPTEVIDYGKLRELVTLLHGELKNESVVIWARFTAELALIYHELRRRQLAVALITGHTPPSIRHQRRLAFQRGDRQALIIQMKCGKYGLDCSRASTAIYYSNTYSLEDRRQTEDRIVHVTKHDPLLYIDLVTRNTVDAAVTQTLREKNLRASVFTSRLIQNLVDVHRSTP